MKEKRTALLWPPLNEIWLFSNAGFQNPWLKRSLAHLSAQTACWWQMDFLNLKLPFYVIGKFLLNCQVSQVWVLHAREGAALQKELQVAAGAAPGGSNNAMPSPTVPSQAGSAHSSLTASPEISNPKLHFNEQVSSSRPSIGFTLYKIKSWLNCNHFPHLCSKSKISFMYQGAFF